MENEITELVVCGMMTHMCVDTTVRAAKDLGYLVTLISDACATKDLEWNGRKLPASLINDVYMASLNGRFATVMSSQIICCKCQVNSDCYGRGEKTLYNRAFRARKSSGKIVLFPHKQRPIAYMPQHPQQDRVLWPMYS